MPRCYPYFTKINGLLYELMSVCENARFSYVRNCVSSTDFIPKKPGIKVLSNVPMAIEASSLWHSDNEPIPEIGLKITNRFYRAATLYQYTGNVAFVFNGNARAHLDISPSDTLIYGPYLKNHGLRWISIARTHGHGKRIFRALRESRFELVIDDSESRMTHGYVRVAMRYDSGGSWDIHSCLFV